MELSFWITNASLNWWLANYKYNSEYRCANAMDELLNILKL